MGIGASAGGLEAFSALLKHLPRDTGMGFVLVQHLDPGHDSALTQLLGRVTSLPIAEVTDHLRVEPDHVYIIPPNKNLGIAAGVLTLRPRPRSPAPHLPIDAFLEALAADQGEGAIGVILSGTGTDGTLGLEAIKAESGITFAQDDSARCDGMPRSAVAGGSVDFVLPPRKIAGELARIAGHPAVAAGRTTEGARPPPPEEDFGKILLLLRGHASIDYSMYRFGALRRRIVRRMVLTGHDTPERYARFLGGNGSELQALSSDLLIGVTSFFRNPEAFEALRRKVWPILLKQRGAGPLRAWTLGCSTGQEAYSIAMSFVEALDRTPSTRRLQIFATDINDALLDKARQGLYPKTIARGLSPQRLRRFFVEEEGGYRVRKALRERIVFARQNVLADPPFSRMDLISCRNLLTDLEPECQRKIVPLFHYALKPGGFLYLGASESVGDFTALFEPRDSKHRFWSRNPGPTPAFRPPARTPRGATFAPGPPGGPSPDPSDAPPAAGPRAEAGAEREADRIAARRFAPPSVLVDAGMRVLQFRGATGAYLEPPTGSARLDLLTMARPGLMSPLRALLDQAKKEDLTARRERVRIEEPGSERMVDIEVIPLGGPRDRCFLVVFEDSAAAPTLATARGKAGRAASRRARPAPRAGGSRPRAALEAELAERRSAARSMEDRHAAALEELQASSEEVQSANEELQSLNEELETSKEEVESANQELRTVNEEMSHRNTELNRLNSDLANTHNSTHVAMVLLARDLRIRQFNVEAGRHFNLRGTDVGRPMGQVRHNLELTDLDAWIAEGIDRLRPREREVQSTEGRWYSLRVRPYLTLDDRVDGAVLVLVDIDDLKRSQLATAAAREYAEGVIGTVREPLLVLDAYLRVESANRAYYQMFGVTPADTLGRFLHDLGQGQWHIPELDALLEDVIPRNGTIEDFPVEQDFESIGRRRVLLNARPMQGAGGHHARIVVAIEDITERTQAEEQLRESEARYRTLFELSPVGVYSCDAAGVIQRFNRGATELWGRTPAVGDTDQLFCGSFQMYRPDGRLMPHAECPMAEVVAGTLSEVRDAEVGIKRPDGTSVTVVVNIRPLKNPRGEVVGAINCFYDITGRKQIEEALRVSDRHKDEFLAMLAHELRNPLAPIRSSIEILRRGRAAGGPPSDPEDHSGYALEVLQRQVGQMVRLVDDLLDAGRISRGKIDLRKERVDLSSVVSHAVEAARPIFEGREQALIVTLPDAPVFLDADPTRLAQIVGNLLNNACKFTERGGRIWLTAERESSGSDPDAGGAGRPPRVVLRVRDTGIGIPADRLGSVFDMFAQGDTSLDRSLSGLGIGLALVRRLTEMHGGSVEAHSAGAGQGSEFIVRLPIAAGEAARDRPAPLPVAAVAAAPLRILIVDDNHDSAEMLAMLLNLLGHETHTAHDGQAAVEAAGALDADVILLDLGLPGLNGYDAARRIRAQQNGKRPPLIVALTGWGQDDARRRSEAAGFDAHLVKPVDDAVLNQLLSHLVARRNAAGSGPPPDQRLRL